MKEDKIEKLREASRRYQRRRRRHEYYKEECRRRARESYRRKRIADIQTGRAKVLHLEKDDVDYILSHHEMTDIKLAEYIGCTRSAVRYHKKKAGLTKSQLKKKALNDKEQKRIWN